MFQIENIMWKRGNTADNDAFVGRPGTASIDTEGRNIRLHDGVTPGGLFRINANDFESLQAEFIVAEDNFNTLMGQTVFSPLTVDVERTDRIRVFINGTLTNNWVVTGPSQITIGDPVGLADKVRIYQYRTIGDLVAEYMDSGDIDQHIRDVISDSKWFGGVNITTLATKASVNTIGQDVEELATALTGEINARTTADANLTGQVSSKIPLAQKGTANGVATLNANGVIPSSQLPGYVDDVIEVTGLPATGEAGKIYVRTTDNTTHRWSGSQWIEINSSVGSADTAAKLATARTISLSGDASGSAAFDGSKNVTFNVTVKDNSHDHTIGNVSGLRAALDSILQDLDGKQNANTAIANAMKLNGVSSTGYLRSDVVDVKTAGELRFNDNVPLSFGSGSNLKVFGNGTNIILDMMGSGANNLLFRNQGTTIMSLDRQSGELSLTGDVAILSDPSVKTNVEPLIDSLARITSLTGYTFDRVDLDNVRQIGLMADEVETAFPEAVKIREDGLLAVNYPCLVAALVESIKSLDQRLSALES